MILTTPHKPMTLAGATSQAFTIESSAKAFQILSSSIYKNPISAIVRELSCNALDSHVSAANPDPFEIHLPNALESWFSLRDFGTGISEADIQVIYTTYFRSTKTNSNTQVGALGLGSKSPFSYTETFTVTSWVEGTKSQYIAFIDSSGAPSLAHCTSEPSSEPSGFEVSFEVSARDFQAFVTETSKFLRTWTSTQPKIIGGVLDSRYKAIDTSAASSIVGSNWTIAGRLYKDSPSKITVVQGNVPYPIDIDAALGDNLPPELAFFVTQLAARKVLIGCELTITVPIGTLDFAPSREELQYTDRTKEQLAQLCTTVVRELGAKLHTLLAAGGNTHFSTAVTFSHIVRDWKSTIPQAVLSELLIIAPYLVGGTQFDPQANIIVPVRTLLDVSTVLKIRANVLATLPIYNAVEGGAQVVYTDPNRIAKFVVIVKDEGASALDKVKYNYLRSSSNYDSARQVQVVLIEKKHSNVTQQEFDEALARYLNALGGYPTTAIVWSSTLAPSPEVASKVKNSFEYRVWTGSVVNTTRRYGSRTPTTPYAPYSWTELTNQITPGTKVLYVPRRNFSIVKDTGESTVQTKLFGDNYTKLKQLGLFGSNIVLVGVQPKHLTGVPTTWENLYTYITRELSTVLSTELQHAELASYVKKRNQYYDKTTISTIMEFYSNAHSVPRGFVQAVADYNQLITLSSTPSTRKFTGSESELAQLGHLFGCMCRNYQHSVLTTYKQTERALKVKYPLLALISSDSVRSNLSELTTYITMVDDSEHNSTN